MQLSQALRLNSKSRLALVGSGGKTTALFQLARQLPGTVLLSASTHLAGAQLAQADHVITVRERGDLPAARDVPQGVVLFCGPTGSDQRCQGLDIESLEGLDRLASELKLPLLIEADGSRQLPLKAPAAHEPPIPGFANQVAVFAGLSGLAKPLGPDWVHRPQIFAGLAGLEPGEQIAAADLVRLLRHPQGGLKNIPVGARRAAILNQADDDRARARALDMVAPLLEDYDGVAIACLQREQVHAFHQPLTAVLLAAGASRRLGRPKQSLGWFGKPLVRHMAEMILSVGFDQVVVVSGAQAEQVEAALTGLEVEIVHNADWQAGQSTSVKRGLAATSDRAGGAIFFLVDQPWIKPELVRALIGAHTASLAPIVAPLIDQQRGNPVLFDRATFAEFDQLSGDQGARPLFARYRVKWVPWHDDRALLDIDTEADYRKIQDPDSSGSDD